MRAQLGHAAALDLAAYLDPIEADNPAAAHREAARLTTTLARLAENPALGRTDRICGVRRAILSFPIPPLRAYDEPDAKGIFVLRLYHQARRPMSR